ncbi:MAG TPA: NADH-quinone oxidoreductase subunit C [Coriobacteriia bacterium]|nr:NADH-quinone oxidoreductase subunit C [Coriobacteriia bacterium]
MTAPATIAPVFENLPGLVDVGVMGPGGMPLAHTTRDSFETVVEMLRERGFAHLEFLTAQERSGEEPGVEMLYGFTRRADLTRVVLAVPLAEDDLEIETLSWLWPGAAVLEREVFDLFGVAFEGHPALKRIVLRDDFEGHPLRKSFELVEGGVTAEQVAKALESHGVAPTSLGADGGRQAYFDPFEHLAGGDPALKSQRMVINIGPQHPSTHGVLHVYLAIDGEQVVGAEPTQGYLHRCIEKLCETRTYKAMPAMLDRCDYVSAFHAELAYSLAMEELLGIESTPRADYLRVLMGELVRITSHHTWFAAAGLDTGALTPFLFAFIDRELILDFFEEVTGGRMMFNYIRPGGVKEDMPEGAADKIRGFLDTFTHRMDECEALLTGNEIFRLRTRGIGFLDPAEVEPWCITGPVARASGIDIDLRRDEPYAAYDRMKINVPLAYSGDTYDRYTVRVAEMREAGRLALEALNALEGIEGPHINPDVPRVIKPEAGTAAYGRVESPRGELGVLVISDGTDKPWRLKVRSPAMSNLHCAPVILQNTKVGDVVAVLGSVDIVMGEIDR